MASNTTFTAEDIAAMKAVSAKFRTEMMEVLPKGRQAFQQIIEQLNMEGLNKSYETFDANTTAQIKVMEEAADCFDKAIIEDEKFARAMGIK